ncbi:MAG: LUD domain-containing protein [Bacteroidota bacterium]
MNSREKILAAVKKNQPALEELPSLQDIDAIRFDNLPEKFKTVLESIGGVLKTADNLQEVTDFVTTHFTEGNKYITSIAELNGIGKITSEEDPHKLEDVEVAIISGAFAVAENSAIWVTEASIKVRVLPFICQHLVVVLNPENIVHNMHEAYARIANADYGYGVFIAGPSKTADIEQSLVLGAHGPKSMTVFIIDIDLIP